MILRIERLVTLVFRLKIFQTEVVYLFIFLWKKPSCANDKHHENQSSMRNDLIENKYDDSN
jgi:hypothetical protein